MPNKELKGEARVYPLFDAFFSCEFIADRADFLSSGGAGGGGGGGGGCGGAIAPVCTPLATGLFWLSVLLRY